MTRYLTIATLVTRFLGPYLLDGLAVHYGEPGDPPPGTMRNGNLFMGDRQACAIDTSLWEGLAGKELLIVSESGKFAVLTVTDSGNLYDAGRFKRGRHKWEKVDWVITSKRVVIDIPHLTFQEIFETSDTQRVRVWVMP